LPPDEKAEDPFHLSALAKFEIRSAKKRWLLRSGLTIQIRAHIGHERPDGEYGVAQPSFGAVKELAPVIYLTS
jgi:hypothetical protein